METWCVPWDSHGVVNFAMAYSVGHPVDCGISHRVDGVVGYLMGYLTGSHPVVGYPLGFSTGHPKGFHGVVDYAIRHPIGNPIQDIPWDALQVP